MTAAEALKLTQEESPELLNKTYASLMEAITVAATAKSKSITIPAPKELSQRGRKKLYATLRKEGFRVSETTLPDSKIEPNRLITTITWAA